MENYTTELNRKSVKKEESGSGLDTHFAKKQEQYGKPHLIGIFRDIEEEVGRIERGEGQYRMK